MNIKRFFTILIILGYLIYPAMTFGSDVSEANYKGTIQASNNGTIANYVCANISLSTDELITSGILNSSATNIVGKDTNGNDTAIMPGYSGNPLIIFYSNIPNNSSGSSYIYTGNVSGGKLYYFPGTTGMSVADNMTEPTDNFSITLNNTFINTVSGNNKLIFSHFDDNNGGVKCFVSETTNGTITALMSKYVTDNFTTSANFIQVYSAGWFAQTFTTPADINYDIISVKVKWYKTGTPGSGTISIRATSDNKPTGGDITSTSFNGNVLTEDTNGQWYTYNLSATELTKNTMYAIVCRLSGGSSGNDVRWRYNATGGYAGGNGASSPDSGVTWTAQTYDITFGYHAQNIKEVEASSLASNEYDIKVWENADYFGIDIDGDTANNTALGGLAVPDSSAVWQFGSSNTTYYIGGVEYTKDGTQKGKWQWEYGTTFLDQSENGNTANATFRTYSSDPDVTATLFSFLPISQAVSNYNSANDWPQIITTPPEQPETAYTENATPGIFFAPVVHSLFSHTDLPESVFWYGFAFFTIIGAGVLVFWVMAKNSQNALLLKMIVMMAIMIFWSLPGPNIYGMYVAIYFGLWCLGVIILSRNYGW